MDDRNSLIPVEYRAGLVSLATHYESTNTLSQAATLRTGWTAASRGLISFRAGPQPARYHREPSTGKAALLQELPVCAYLHYPTGFDPGHICSFSGG